MHTNVIEQDSEIATGSNNIQIHRTPNGFNIYQHDIKWVCNMHLLHYLYTEFRFISNCKWVFRVAVSVMTIQDTKYRTQQ
jgi:hypothetical protein